MAVSVELEDRTLLSRFPTMGPCPCGPSGIAATVGRVVYTAQVISSVMPW
jgi:hypothetical protein